MGFGAGLLEGAATEVTKLKDEKSQQQERDREQTATLLEKQMDSIAANRAAAKAQLDALPPDSPQRQQIQTQIQGYEDALKQGIQNYQSLYGSDTKGLFGRIQGWLQNRNKAGANPSAPAQPSVGSGNSAIPSVGPMQNLPGPPFDPNAPQGQSQEGKQNLPGPAPTGQKPSAAEALRQMYEAAAPYQAPAADPLKGMNDFIAQAMAANPKMTREQAMAEWWKQEQIKAHSIPEAKQTPDKYMPGLTTTIDKDGNEHHWRVPMEPGGKPEEVDFGGQKVQPKTPPKGPAVGSAADYIQKLYPNGATADQTRQARIEFDAADAKAKAEAAAGTTVSTHQIIHDNGDGTSTVFDLTNSSTKSFPDSQQTPGDLKKNVPKGTNGANKGTVHSGDILTGKATAVQRKAEQNYNDAVKMSEFANDALAHPSAAKDKLLAGALIRQTEGRFNDAQYDNLVKKAGLANSFEGWLNSATSGELPSDVRKQLVDAAQANLKAAKAAVDSAKGTPAPGAIHPGMSDEDFLNRLNKKP